MKKKSLFLGGALMFAMTFSTTVLTSCHDDDKKYEEVEDPLRSQTAYYIAGTGLTHYSFYHKYFLCCIPNN